MDLNGDAILNTSLNTFTKVTLTIDLNSFTGSTNLTLNSTRFILNGGSVTSNAIF